MKKVLTLLLTASICTSFAAEFVAKTASMMYKQNKVAELKTYLTTNTECKTPTAESVYQCYTMWVETKTTNAITDANIGDVILAKINAYQAKTPENKFIFGINLFRRAPYVLKPKNKTNLRAAWTAWFGENKAEIIKTGDVFTIGAAISTAGTANDAFKWYMEYKRYIQAFNKAVVNNLGTNNINESLTLLIQNININHPSQLNMILHSVSRLSKNTNTQINTNIKQLLLILNRQIYPKLQNTDGEKWKPGLIKLNLLMKAYNIQ